MSGPCTESTTFFLVPYIALYLKTTCIGFRKGVTVLVAWSESTFLLTDERLNFLLRCFFFSLWVVNFRPYKNYFVFLILVTYLNFYIKYKCRSTSLYVDIRDKESSDSTLLENSGPIYVNFYIVSISVNNLYLYTKIWYLKNELRHVVLQTPAKHL